MAMKRTCDRCGKEINSTIIPRQLIKTGFIDKRYDLCNECFDEFDEWIKGETRTSEGLPDVEEAL